MSEAAEQEVASKFRRLVELRESRDSTKLSAEKAEKEYRDYERELLDEIEESPQQGSRKYNLDDLGTITFTPRETRFGRIVDQEAALKYFEDHAETENVTRQEIRKGRLHELVRERTEQGKPLPDGVDFYVKRSITISRKK